MTDNPITVGGEYVENPDFVPNPLDQTGVLRTDGLGGHNKPEDVSPVYAVDKVKTAQEIKAALDPDNTYVSSEKVLLPGDVDAETAQKSILAKADAVIDKGVVIGGPSDREKEAALSGEDGAYAAQQDIQSHARDNAALSMDAGKHDGGGQPYGSTADDLKTASAGKGVSDSGSEGTETADTTSTEAKDDKVDEAKSDEPVVGTVDTSATAGATPPEEPTSSTPAVDAPAAKKATPAKKA